MKKAPVKTSAAAPPPDDRIDLSDMPEVRDWYGSTRGLAARPELRLISIRLSAADLVTANHLAHKKGLPYQTYIKSLLHQSLEREWKENSK